MSIDVTLTTVTDRITNPDGDNAYGWVTLRPNQAFNYNDGVSTVTVSTEAVKIAISDGQLQSALTVHPTKNASHNVETFYVVTYDVDGEQWTEYFEISNTPTTLEWGDITRVLENQDVTDAVNVHEAASDPHSQYLLRSESYETSPGAGAMSDAKGPAVRALAASGLLDSSFLNPAANPTNDDQVVVDDGGLSSISGTDLESIITSIDSFLTAGYAASAVSYNNATSGLTATDVQAAIDELENEIDGKAATSHSHVMADVTDAGALATLDTVGTAQIDNEAVTVAKLADGTSYALSGWRITSASAKEVDFAKVEIGITLTSNPAAGSSHSYGALTTGRAYMSAHVKAVSGTGSPVGPDYVPVITGAPGAQSLTIARVSGNGTPDAGSVVTVALYYLDFT